MNLKKLYIIIGKMGSGKTTIVEKVSDILNIEIVKSTTSRPKREGEDDNSYIFVDENYFYENIDNFIEYKTYDTIYGKWHYGIEYKTLENIKGDRAFIISTPLGCEDIINNLKSINPNIDTKIIYITSRKHIRLFRTLNRGDNMEEVLRRFEADEIDFLNIERLKAIYIDNNGVLDYAITHFIDMVNSF